MKYGPCWSPNTDGPSTPQAWQAAANLYGPRQPITRITPALSDMFPAPDRVDLAIVRETVQNAYRASFTININPSSLPPWVTGGRPVFQGGIRGSAWQYINTFARDAAWAAAAWKILRDEELTANKISVIFDAGWLATRQRIIDRLKIEIVWVGMPSIGDASYRAGEFLNNYVAEAQGVEAWDDPLNGTGGPTHFWGSDPKYADADYHSAPRPWLLPENLAKTVIDAQAAEFFGETIGEEFAHVADIFSAPINEPDIFQSNPLISIDGVNRPGGPNVIRDILLPQLFVPYFRGLRNGIGRSEKLSASPRSPRFAGYDVAYPGTAAERVLGEPGMVKEIDLGTAHAYGGFDHVAQYDKMFRRANLPWLINEIAGTNMAGWLRHVHEMRISAAAVVFLVTEPSGVPHIADFAKGGTEPTAEGLAIKAVIAEQNSRRRAAGK